MEGHPGGLQRGRAEAVDRRAGHVVVDACDQCGVAADVVASLAGVGSVAHHHVDDRLRVELRVALDDRAQRHRGEVVGADRFERSLDGAPDGRADGVDDHCFGHVRLSPWLVERRWIGRRQVAGRRRAECECEAIVCDRRAQLCDRRHLEPRRLRRPPRKRVPSRTEASASSSAPRRRWPLTMSVAPAR